MASTTTFQQELDRAIEIAVKNRVRQITEEEINKTINTCIERIRNSIDEIALNILKHYSISEGKNELIIHVKKDI